MAMTTDDYLKMISKLDKYITFVIGVPNINDGVALSRFHDCGKLGKFKYTLTTEYKYYYCESCEEMFTTGQN